MAQDYIIDGQTLTDIGNAIREKSGTSDMLAPQAMPDAIRAISGGTVTKEEIVEALGYVPANGTKFRLIEEVTLQEDTTNFERSQTPEGDAYNLRSIIVEIDASSVLNRQSAYAWVRLNSTQPYEDWRYIANGEIVSASNAVSYFVWRKTSDGSIDTWFAAAPNNGPTGQTSLGDTKFIPSNVLRSDVLIADFKLYTTDGAIPAGTKISIYGIDAAPSTVSDIQAALSAYGLSVQDGKLCVRVERE